MFDRVALLIAYRILQWRAYPTDALNTYHDSAADMAAAALSLGNGAGIRAVPGVNSAGFHEKVKRHIENR